MIKVFRNAVIWIVVHASSLITHIVYVCSKVVASKQTPNLHLCPQVLLQRASQTKSLTSAKACRSITSVQT